MRIITAALLPLVIGCSGSAGDEDELAVITSNFDRGDEGWTITDFITGTDYQSPVSDTTPAWDEAGYIVHADDEHLSFFFTAPEAFLGEREGYLGGALWFSLRTDHIGWDEDSYVVLLSDAAAVYYRFTGPDSESRWQDYEVPLHSEDGGWTAEAPGGEAAAEADLVAALEGLTALYIAGELAAELRETVSLDGVALVPPER